MNDDSGATAKAPVTRVAPASELPGGRRWAIRACLALATVLAVISIFAIWADRQVFDANNWGDTSEEMLQNADVRDQVSQLMVDTVYANVDVANVLGQQLPPALQPLAAPIAGGLRQLAERRTERTLQRPRVQEAWKQANILTAKQFIAIAENKPNAVIGAQGNAVVLDLRQLVIQLVEQLGLPGKVVGQIPPGAGKVKVMSANEVSLLQDATRVLSGLATWLFPLTIVLFAFAVYLARGRRRAALMYVGVDLIVAGVLVLIIRNVAGGAVVSALATTPSVEPAANAVWSIGTQILRDVAGACVIIGIPVVIAAWLAGPMQPAPAIRNWSAPWLIDRPGVSYGVLFALLALIVAWGPIPATQKPIPVLIMVVLACVGLQAQRRQVAEEQGTTLGDALGPDSISA